jgi:hypothetical protein
VTMAEDQARIEGEVRRRLTEAAAAGGVPHSRASLEVLYLLPDSFLRVWIELFDAALKLPSSPTGGTVRQGELGKANSGDALRGTHKGLRTDSSANAGSAPHLGGGAEKKGPGGWHVKNTRALEIKGRMDKRLRSLARDIRRELAGVEDDGRDENGRQRAVAEVLQCSGCGRIADRAWNWCPHCGGRFPAVS